MKKLFVLPALLFSMMIFQSCSKSATEDLRPNTPPRPDKVIEATVGSGETYSINVSLYGELSINTQAAHYRISQASTNPESGSRTYTYSPLAGFKGQDEVLLAHKTEYIYSSNSSCSYGSNSAIGTRTNYIAVKFTVTDK